MNHPDVVEVIRSGMLRGDSRVCSIPGPAAHYAYPQVMLHAQVPSRFGIHRQRTAIVVFLMTDRTHGSPQQMYRGRTGAGRVPLKPAVWAFLVLLRGYREPPHAAWVSHVGREAGLSAAEIDALVAHVNRGLADMTRLHRAWADDVCRHRGRYRDKELLARSVELATAQERRCRDRYLRGVRKVLPREQRRRLLAWIATEWRSHASMVEVDHGAFVRSAESIDDYLDRVCGKAS